MASNLSLPFFDSLVAHVLYAAVRRKAAWVRTDNKPFLEKARFDEEAHAVALRNMREAYLLESVAKTLLPPWLLPLCGGEGMRNPLELLIVLAVVGFAVWLFETLIPINATIQRVMYAIGGIALFLYVLQFFGILPRVFH